MILKLREFQETQNRQNNLEKEQQISRTEHLLISKLILPTTMNKTVWYQNKNRIRNQRSGPESSETHP